MIVVLPGQFPHFYTCYSLTLSFKLNNTIAPEKALFFDLKKVIFFSYFSTKTNVVGTH